MGQAGDRVASSQMRHTMQLVHKQHSRSHETSCKRHGDGPGQQQAAQYPDKQREIEAMPPVQETNHKDGAQLQQPQYVT